MALGPNPPICRDVMRDLNINPFTPIERYRAYVEMTWNVPALIRGMGSISYSAAILEPRPGAPWFFR